MGAQSELESAALIVPETLKVPATGGRHSTATAPDDGTRAICPGKNLSPPFATGAVPGLTPTNAEESFVAVHPDRPPSASASNLSRRLALSR